MEDNKVLTVENLSVSFSMYDKGLNHCDLKVISELSLDVKAGEILAIAGSSGSGKSLLAHAILGLLPQNASTGGEMRYRGEVMTDDKIRSLRGDKIAFVPQSVSYLDPLMKIGKQVRGVRGTGKKSAQKKIFSRLELDERTDELYPFQLSGGMARRALVSTAVISGAELIIADEPTPGMTLEQSLEALKIFRELADSGKAIILITHDIDLAYSFADRIAIFYAGTTVEVATAEEFKTGPAALRHPYSKALWRALPQHEFRPIEGVQPYAGTLPTGCLFCPRCEFATADCTKPIEMRELRGGYVRCIHAT